LEIIKRLTDMDVPNCLPYLMELAIVLEDNKLHEIFLHSDGLAILIKLLHNALKTAEDSNVEECNDSALASIVSSLLNLASGNLSVQRQLAADNVVLLNIVRASMLTSNALIARRHCAALLHLLSQATGRRFVPSFNFERAPADWAELWSKSLVRTSAKFVFNAQYTSTPGGHIPAFMKLTDEQLEQVKGANDFLLIKEAVNTVTNARSHEDVHSVRT
jgi:hypothetical protein